MGESILVKLAVQDPFAGMPEIPTNGMYTQNITYTCTYTGNYLITCVGGGGASGAGVIQNIKSYDVPRAVQEDTGYWQVSGKKTWLKMNNIWGGAGGSGYLNTAVVSLNRGDTVTITIGQGGTPVSGGNGGTGGTTSFGEYVYASGGTGGKSPLKYGLSNNYSNDYTNNPFYIFMNGNQRNMGGQGLSNGLPYFNGSYQFETTSSVRYARNGTPGSLYTHQNGSGFIVVNTNNSGDPLYFGAGGQAQSVSPWSGTAGNSGVIYVNYIN